MPISNDRGKANRQVNFAQELIVSFGIALASCCPAVQVGQFGRNNRRLERVEAEIASNNLVIVLRPGPMRSQASKSLRPLAIIGDDHSRIAGGSKILRGKEREAPVMADRTRPAAFLHCSTFGPRMKCWDSNTLAIAASTSPLMAAYCALRSSSGTFIVGFFFHLPVRFGSRAQLGWQWSFFV